MGPLPERARVGRHLQASERDAARARAAAAAAATAAAAADDPASEGAADADAATAPDDDDAWRDWELVCETLSGLAADLAHRGSMQPVSFHRNVLGEKATTPTSTPPGAETKYPTRPRVRTELEKKSNGRVWVPGF